ncbi:MAG: aminotransferase class I/II-fold pyridoxal phosphate-dependent enzyme [Burkholderiales bacterium]
MNPAHFARRMQDIEPFHVMEVLQRARQLEQSGRRIAHFEIGQPDFGAPQAVIEAGIKAMREQHLGYTPALGLMPLRESIAAYYSSRYGVTVSPSCVAVTTGSSAALLLALSALVGPGDEVLLPDPCYPCARHLVSLCDARPMSMSTDESSAYQPTGDQVAAAWRDATRGVLLASPSNPAGSIIDAKELSAILSAAKSRSGFVIIDEIYADLVYDAKPVTALSISRDAIIVGGFSKYFCMTGWRLGWLIAPEALIREVEKLAQNLYVSPPALAQYAALAAFLPESLDVLEQRRTEFRERRDYLFHALRSIGFGIPLLPEGAFYLYTDCGGFTADSEQFAKQLLEQSGVAVAPGLDFGHHRANSFVRFAYTRSRTEIEEGVDRLSQALANRG